MINAVSCLSLRVISGLLSVLSFHKGGWAVGQCVFPGKNPPVLACLAVSVVECGRWLVLLYRYEAIVSLPVLSRAVDRALVILG